MRSPCEHVMSFDLDQHLLRETVEELFEHAPCGNLSTLPDGTIILVNQTFASWTGHTREWLLSGVRYVKDNRLLPRGMSRTAATADVAVHGSAAQDADFGDGRDRVTYRVPRSGAQGPLTITDELWYQPIGFRWAVNLRGYDAPEPKRFVGYWDSMAGESALMLVKATATTK